MNEFFKTYQTELSYAFVVVCAFLLLQLVTNLFHKWLIQKEKKKFSGANPSAINLVRRILNALWLVLGIMAISSLFFEDIYEKFQTRFRIIIYLGFVAVITIVVASSMNVWFRRRLEWKLETNEDPTTLKFLRYVVVIFVYTIGVLVALLAFPSLKGVAQTALGGAGVIALIAGVASQEALANLVGGVFIISFKPFKIGDRIKMTDTMVGTVIDITLRHTVLRNFDNKMIVIPNAMINREKLINYDLGEKKICERIDIGISYDSNVSLAKKIMQEECEKHPLILDNRSAIDILNGKPMIRVALTAINDSSVTIRVWAWAQNFSHAYEMRCDLLESIKKRFEDEGIKIPFPHRTLVFKETGRDTEKEDK